jgi:hypothetical protein
MPDAMSCWDALAAVDVSMSPITAAEIAQAQAGRGVSQRSAEPGHRTS